MQRLGVRHITGSDLAPTAVERRAELYPTATVKRVDIGDADLPLPTNAYDAIAIIDVHMTSLTTSATNGRLPNSPTSSRRKESRF